MRYGSNGPNKACIWIKYRQYHLSALLDTSSDVTIAGEDVAKKMGWQIVEHRIKQVKAANNKLMYIIGAAYVDLTVGNRTICRIRPVLSDLNEESDSMLESNNEPVQVRCLSRGSWTKTVCLFSMKKSVNAKVSQTQHSPECPIRYRIRLVLIAR